MNLKVRNIDSVWEFPKNATLTSMVVLAYMFVLLLKILIALGRLLYIGHHTLELKGGVVVLTLRLL